MATVIQRDTNFMSAIAWTTAVYPPWQIVTKYSLPVLIKVSATTDKRLLHRVPGLEGLVCKLQKMVRIEQVTARVMIPSWIKDDGITRSLASSSSSCGRGGPTILTIPQEYLGLFQIVANDENPECLKGVEALIRKRPRVVKVIEGATNIPKSALITLKVGDLLQVGDTCKRATHDGIKEYIRCDLNNRVIVLNPTWNGVYEEVHDDIQYSMRDLLKRFPLPITVKLVHLEKHSKALLEMLPNGGKTCHLVLSTKTNAEFILGVDLDNQTGLVIAEDIDINLHIPEWVSPSNAIERREKMTPPSESFGDDIRVDQVICGCKEQLILLKPWKDLFVGPVPKLHPRTFNVTLPAHNDPPPYRGPIGDYSNDRGILTNRDLVDDIQYISGPVMPNQQQPGLLKRELLDHISYITGPVIAKERVTPVYVSLDEEGGDVDDEPPLPPPREESLRPRKNGAAAAVDDDDDSDGYEKPIDGQDDENDGYEKPISTGDEQDIVNLEPTSDKSTELKPHEIMIRKELQKERELLKQNAVNTVAGYSEELVSADNLTMSGNDDAEYNSYEEIDSEDDDQVQAVDFSEYVTLTKRTENYQNVFPSTTRYQHDDQPLQFPRRKKLSAAEGKTREIQIPKLPASRHLSQSHRAIISTENTMNTVPRSFRYHNRAKTYPSSLESTQTHLPAQETTSTNEMPADDGGEYDDIIVGQDPHTDESSRDSNRDISDQSHSAHSKNNYVNTVPRNYRYRHSAKTQPPPQQDGSTETQLPTGQETTSTDDHENPTKDGDEYDATIVGLDIPEEDESSKDVKLVSSDHPDEDASAAPRVQERNTLEALSVDDVIQRLQSLRIPESVQELFKQEQVDGVLLVRMNENILTEEFEMTAFHAMKLVRFITGWRPT